MLSMPCTQKAPATALQGVAGVMHAMLGVCICVHHPRPLYAQSAGAVSLTTMVVTCTIGYIMLSRSNTILPGTLHEKPPVETTVVC